MKGNLLHSNSNYVLGYEEFSSTERHPDRVMSTRVKPQNNLVNKSYNPSVNLARTYIFAVACIISLKVFAVENG